MKINSCAKCRKTIELPFEKYESKSSEYFLNGFYYHQECLQELKQELSSDLRKGYALMTFCIIIPIILSQFWPENYLSQKKY